VEGINPCLVRSIGPKLHLLDIYLSLETVGLSLREQLQATPVPIDESDWKLDMLVTPDEVIGAVE
jgi:5-formyltetrahydrofolate cyclo-ligase